MVNLLYIITSLFVKRPRTEARIGSVLGGIRDSRFG